MGCAEGTARSYLSRGSERLRDYARAAGITVEVNANPGPWNCRPTDEGEMTPPEVEAFKNQALDNAQVSIDADKSRAHVVIPEDASVVYELDVRPAGPDDYEIVSVVRCAG